eukprot:758214-Amorphochlora_amoeboformis.AAC.1
MVHLGRNSGFLRFRRLKHEYTVTITMRVHIKVLTRVRNLNLSKHMSTLRVNTCLEFENSVQVAVE